MFLSFFVFHFTEGCFFLINFFFWQIMFMQAYTTELEQEVAHLEKENAKLRRQLEQVNERVIIFIQIFFNFYVKIN